MLGVLGWASVAAGCTAMGGEAFVNRSATLAVHVLTPDARAGVPCTGRALLFGEDEQQVDVVSGAATTLSVGMLTALSEKRPIKAHVALRVACQGYAATTTEARAVGGGLPAPPRVDFGSVTVGSRR